MDKKIAIKINYNTEIQFYPFEKYLHITIIIVHVSRYATQAALCS